MNANLADDRGFTLIELMVVIMIISILAAIAVPSYLRQRERSADAKAQADVRNMVTHIESCFVKTDDYRKCTTSASLGEGIGIPLGTQPGQVDVQSDADTGYRITAFSRSKISYTIEKAANTWSMERSCEVPAGSKDRGGCPADGKW